MKTLKYQSQSVAKLYFIGAIALFVGQIVFGLALVPELFLTIFQNLKIRILAKDNFGI